MAVTTKWRQHIEAWQRSGLSQAAYCAEQRLNVRTFTARLSDYRKLSPLDSTALIPVQIKPAAAEAIVFTHAQRATAWSCRLQRRRAGSRSCCDAWPDRESGADLAGGDAGRYAPWPGWLNRHRPAQPGAFAWLRIGLHLPQPGRQPLAPVAVGR